MLYTQKLLSKKKRGNPRHFSLNIKSPHQNEAETCGLEPARFELLLYETAI